MWSVGEYTQYKIGPSCTSALLFFHQHLVCLKVRIFKENDRQLEQILFLRFKAEKQMLIKSSGCTDVVVCQIVLMG